jgi:hypothetical protein
MFAAKKKSYDSYHGSPDGGQHSLHYGPANPFKMRQHSSEQWNKTKQKNAYNFKQLNWLKIGKHFQSRWEV